MAGAGGVFCRCCVARRRPTGGPRASGPTASTPRRGGFSGGRSLYPPPPPRSLSHYPPRMLFDLEADPHQTVDLAEAEPAVVERLDGVLRAWELEQVTATGLSDPLRDVQPHQPSMLAAFDAYLDRLRAAGRDI